MKRACRSICGQGLILLPIDFSAIAKSCFIRAGWTYPRVHKPFGANRS